MVQILHLKAQEKQLIHQYFSSFEKNEKNQGQTSGASVLLIEI